ncbi:BCCT family transporter [Photobacterium halotolerans]|uniref:BCCT family transporter n=1 Tax=Photobacterium halotolerans TaxID=265726 RepID=UPI001372F804|nr:BCCT family transporter [Photobacterium halotolerans]NAX46395.1 BCCT family transporter [Photobacterium halotolerans]
MQTSKQHSADKMVSALTIGFLSLFLIAALVDLSWVSSSIQSLFALSTASFGYFWQWLMVLNFILALCLALSPLGKIKLGNTERPEIGQFRWTAMIMCTLLAGGGVFWSAAEPIYHFVTTPPAFDGLAARQPETVAPALSQSFLHWGFLAWAVLGTLATIVLMYAHHQKGIKLRPRALLYPLVGDRLENHWLGSVIDASSILAVAAGTIGPIGFLASQLGYSLHVVAGLDNSVLTQIGLLAVVVTIYSLSAATGMDKGLQWLSRFNVIVAVLLLLVMLLLGPTDFIFEKFAEAMTVYIQHFPAMSLTNASPDWNAWWTWFFWGWFIGFAPMMAIFIARITVGRSIRELVMTVAIGAPLVTHFWFTVLGGSGIYFELTQPGVISDPLSEGGLPAVLLATLSQLPFSEWLIPAFLVLTTTFVVTTGDSMAYAIAMVTSGKNEPARGHRLFWAIAMGAVAAVLLLAGDGGLNALQSFIVITAVPVSLLMVFTLLTGPLAAIRLHRETDVASPESSLITEQ